MKLAPVPKRARGSNSAPASSASGDASGDADSMVAMPEVALLSVSAGEHEQEVEQHVLFLIFSCCVFTASMSQVVHRQLLCLSFGSALCLLRFTVDHFV